MYLLQDSKYRYRDLQQTTWKEAQWHIIRRSMKGGPATGTTMGHWIVVLESAKRAEKGQGFSCAVRAGPVLGLVLWYVWSGSRRCQRPSQGHWETNETPMGGAEERDLLRPRTGMVRWRRGGWRWWCQHCCCRPLMN